MGGVVSDLPWKTPEHIPPPNVKPGFDPQFGFKASRKPKVSRLSEQEMKALQLRNSLRDYCAHHIRDYLVCEERYKPLIPLCRPEIKAYVHCQMNEYILRMKEYEREKRLRARELRKLGKVVQ